MIGIDQRVDLGVNMFGGSGNGDTHVECIHTRNSYRLIEANGEGQQVHRIFNEEIYFFDLGIDGIEIDDWLRPKRVGPNETLERKVGPHPIQFYGTSIGEVIFNNNLIR